MELLQTKDCFLRLNREQVINTVENWQVNRANIEPDSLPLYDSLFEDLLDQMRPHGYEFQIDTTNAPDDGAAEAKEMLDMMIQALNLILPRSAPGIQKTLEENVLPYARRLRQMVKEET